MAQPNTPDKFNSPVALRATPGQFDWIRMHPSFRSPAGSSDSSATLHSTDTRVLPDPNHVSSFANDSTGTHHRPSQFRPVEPLTSLRQQPTIISKTNRTSSYSEVFNNPSIHANSPNLSTPAAHPNRQSADTHSDALSHENDWMGQFRSPSSNSYSYQSRYQTIAAPTQQMQHYDSRSQNILSGASSNLDLSSNQSVSSAIQGVPQGLKHGVKRTQKLPRSTESPLGGCSNSLSLDQSRSESIDPRLIEFDASITRQRSQSPAASEDSGITKEDRIDDLSSDDEDYREWRADLEKKRKDKEFFTISQNPARRRIGRNGIVPRGGHRGARGPRKAAEPTGDIKARLGEAAKAFVAGQYTEAVKICAEIIRINAETHEAWTTTASCFLELGHRDKALTAFTFAAHLQPKIIQGWLNCAILFLEETGKRRQNALHDAFFCYGAALAADSKNVDARLGKAKIYVERNNSKGAISEYNKVLRLQPRNLGLIRDLCAAYYDHGELENAASLYKITFAQFMENRRSYDDVLDWSDLDSYIAIYQQLEEHNAALKELKLIARWMLRRGAENFWDNVTNDDREWDADDSRRVEIREFTEDDFPLSTYGDGLPLELRTKLGISRLGLGEHEEAMRHFEWLMGSNEDGEDKVLSYFDLYRQIADTFHAAGLYQRSLEFYEPLKQVPEANIGDLYVQMGYCFQAEKRQAAAEECFQTAIQLDEQNVEARMQLAKLYESLNEQEQAFIYVNEVMSIKTGQNAQSLKKLRKRGPREAKADEPPSERSKEMSQQPSDDEDFASENQYKHKRRRLADPKGKLEEEMSRAEQLQLQYRTLRSRRVDMLNGNRQAARAWMAAARDLTDDFRAVRSFYPFEKHLCFLGYRAREYHAGADIPLDDEATAMAERLSQHLGADIADKTRVPKIEVPEDYRGISFSSWLDIFLDFALCLARHGKSQESYEICEAAKDCALWYHSREPLFLIHVCWMTCGLFLSDEETCVTVARFFMKDYQFTTDSYRMWTTVTRMVHSPVSWYCAGPSQKFILRQIKAMDYSLITDEEIKAKHFAERGSYSAVDEKNQLIINTDLDIALLMLYGHILYSGSSYIYALNYFLRALALDPENPMINLSCGLAYVHYALRRQADNRQYLILQGLTFLFTYYNSRKTSTKLDERQEAHYNIGRIYHMLGLTNLAVPYYELVFKEFEGAEKAESREDIVTDTAYNLQSIYAMSGNQELAMKISRKWLVI